MIRKYKSILLKTIEQAKRSNEMRKINERVTLVEDNNIAHLAIVVHKRYGDKF